MGIVLVNAEIGGCVVKSINKEKSLNKSATVLAEVILRIVYWQRGQVLILDL